jgi:phosphatidylserine/phosphatidylglycerophosphate/cardiolipin synthase-like enzyme
MVAITLLLPLCVALLCQRAVGAAPAGCTSAFDTLCGAARRASVGNCYLCVNAHQAELGNAGCSPGDVEGLCSPPPPPDPSYDHQTQDYVQEHAPVTVRPSQRDAVSVTPFFSPTNSSAVLVALINSARDSLDIGSPGFSSWSGCTPYAHPGDTCVRGCTPSKMAQEKFPVFQAILNAVHRGVRVRLLTNDYGLGDCPGTITPLTFVAMNGVTVRFYTSTTFYHAKYISVDGVRMSISSINFSRTSFTRNREAGAVIESAAAGSQAAAPLLQMAAAVFQADWGQSTARAIPSGSWSSSNRSIIANTSQQPVILPPPSKTWAAYWNPPTPQAVSVGGDGADSAEITVTTSPDFSALALQLSMDSARESLSVMIYQITGDDVVARLLAMVARGVRVHLLVSSSIYGAADCALANRAYSTLKAHAPSIRIYKTTRHYTYSHQKVSGNSSCSVC